MLVLSICDCIFIKYVPPDVTLYAWYTQVCAYCWLYIPACAYGWLMSVLLVETVSKSHFYAGDVWWDFDSYLYHKDLVCARVAVFTEVKQPIL